MTIRKVPVPPRLLVDITPTARVEGDLHLGLDLPLAEIAHRLLSQPDLMAVPVLVRDGRLLAIDADAARESLLTAAPPEGETVLHRPPPAVAPPTLPAVEAPASPPPPAGIRLRVTGVLRRVARGAIASLPASIREDARATLIHTRQVVRILAYGTPPQPAAPPLASPLPVPSPSSPPAPPPPRRPPPPLRAGPRLEVHPRPGDVLWTGGTASPWTTMRAISGMRAGHGLRVVALAQDLPSLRNDAAALVATTLQAELLQGSDLILASSSTAADTLRAAAAGLGWPTPSIRLVQASAQHREAPSDWPTALPRTHFALVTGSVARDSGHAELVTLWEELAAQQDFALNLIILGAPGEHAGDAVKTIESSALFDTRVFWLREAAGPLLQQLHATCDLLIFPGAGEAWPAAVVEALWLGRPVLAARRGTIPPESLGLATLVAPDAPEEWQAAILAAAAKAVRPASPPPTLPGPAAVEAALRGLLTQAAAA